MLSLSALVIGGISFGFGVLSVAQAVNPIKVTAIHNKIFFISIFITSLIT
jgi:hypothetical protein